MTSALVIWNYHRKLSSASMGNDEQKELEERRRKRALSISSNGQGQLSGSDRENRSGSEEDLDGRRSPNEEKPKSRRRFSLDFLFSRKAKKAKKEKSQRAKSMSESSTDEDTHRRYRRPSTVGAEFALAM